MEIESFWTRLPKESKTRKQSALNRQSQWQYDERRNPSSHLHPKVKSKRQRKSNKRAALIEPYKPRDPHPEKFVSFNKADIMSMTLSADFPNEIGFFDDENLIIDDLNETPTIFEERPLSLPDDKSRHKLMKFINSIHNYSLFHKTRRRRCVNWKSFCRSEFTKLQNRVRLLEGKVRSLTTQLKSLK